MSLDSDAVVEVISDFISEIVGGFDIVKRKLDWQYNARAFDVVYKEKVLGTVWVPYDKDNVKFFNTTVERKFTKDDLIDGSIWKEITPDLLREALRKN